MGDRITSRQHAARRAELAANQLNAHGNIGYEYPLSALDRRSGAEIDSLSARCDTSHRGLGVLLAYRMLRRWKHYFESGCVGRRAGADSTSMGLHNCFHDS